MLVRESAMALKLGECLSQLMVPKCSQIYLNTMYYLITSIL